MMVDDRSQGQDGEPTKTTPPPPALSESPSRKRRPRQESAATSSDSALSSDSTSDRHRKKTRDLPNLSDCHSCGLHVNSTNPKDKLQTLDSLWRIVLLCRRCIKRVETAELCSYCFSEADADGYRCRDCERRIHRDCVVRYRCFAPWSYCNSELGFSVCIDCWVPKLLANATKVYNRGKRNKKNVLKPCSESEFRVLGNSGGPWLEDVVNNAKTKVEKNTAAAAKAKENALRKAVVARSAVELASGALELVSKKARNRGRDGGSASSASDVSNTRLVDDDAALAFRLHRAMNSSSRISKDFCFINSSCLNVPRIEDSNSNASVGSRESPNPSVSGKIEVCSTIELSEKMDATVSERSVYVPSDGGSSIRLSSFSHYRLVYRRKYKKDEEYLEKGGGVVGKWNIGDDQDQAFASQTWQKQDGFEYPFHLDDTRNQGQLICDGNTTILDDGRCYRKLDRYMLKYSRRHVGLKTIPGYETNSLYDVFCVENMAIAVELPQNRSRYLLKYRRRPAGLKASSGTKMVGGVSCDESKTKAFGLPLNPSRYMLKYSKRPAGSKAISSRGTKILYEVPYPESKTEDVGGLPLDCSEDCRTFSDASFQSYNVRASACANGSSLDLS